MPYEELTTVQTVAEEFTEVASATNTLLDTYHVQQSDVVAYDVEPFGQNKFLISIIYLFKISEKFWDELGLKSIGLTTLSTFNRALSTSAALKSSLTVNPLTWNRIKTVSVVLKNSLSTLFNGARTFDAISIGLGVTLENFETLGLAPRKTPISLVIGFVRGLFEGSRKPDNITIGLSGITFSAWYNGVPIEE